MDKKIEDLKVRNIVYLLQAQVPIDGTRRIKLFEIKREEIENITPFEDYGTKYIVFGFASGNEDYFIPLKAKNLESYSECYGSEIQIFATSMTALKKDLRECGFFLANGPKEPPTIEEEILTQLQNLNAKASQIVDLLQELK